jgi:hypothetical protein
MQLSYNISTNWLNLEEVIPKNHHICAGNTQNHHYSPKLQKTTGIARIGSNVHWLFDLARLTWFLTLGPTVGADVARCACNQGQNLDRSNC